MDWHQRIVSDPQIMVGKPVVKGTRLTVEHLLELLAGGWSEADLLEAYPALAQEDLQACYAFLAETLRQAVKVLESRSDWPGHFSVVSPTGIRTTSA